jgi:hypothetical protein
MFAAYNGIQGHARCLFVLMGDFTSKPLMHGQDGRQQLIGTPDTNTESPTYTNTACVFRSLYPIYHP